MAMCAAVRLPGAIGTGGSTGVQHGGGPGPFPEPIATSAWRSMSVSAGAAVPSSLGTVRTCDLDMPSAAAASADEA
jgi:hypothetical protein